MTIATNRKNLPLKEVAKVSLIFEMSDFEAMGKVARKHNTTTGKFLKRMVLEAFKEKYA